MANITTDYILDKLNQVPNPNQVQVHPWSNWTDEEKQKLLNIYLIISKKENHIFDLIYRCHGCDSWEDIFRDYNTDYLNDKAGGVQVAIDQLVENKLG